MVYQIYPRSFKDSDGDGVGDLNGVIEKLDYLNDGSTSSPQGDTGASLGVNAIWLNPVYTSPMKDFGYDISDYRDIDPLFGNLEMFDRLIQGAHKRNIKVIMDFVANHTSSEHPWFQESKSSKDNPKRNWYIWRDAKPDGSPPSRGHSPLRRGEGPPNNWLSVFGGPAWSFDEKTKQYYMHSFLPDQPDLNWRHKPVRDEMADILKFWLTRGVDGFRTDAVYHIVKDEEFRDDPPNPNYIAGRQDPYESLLHIYSQGRPELKETTNTLCNVLGVHSNDVYMVSEAYIGVPQMAEFYKACDNGLHAPLNFNLMTTPWDGESFKRFIDDFEASLRPSDWPNYVFGNHDRSRLATRIGQERSRLAAMLMFTLRGMPFIYYGEELGMEDVAIPENNCLDPWGRNVPGFNVGRDPERTPMQWDGSPHAGFTDGNPWLPVAPDYKERNAEAASRDPRSMLSFYKELIRQRKNSPALLTGAYKPLESGNKNVLAFGRECEAETLLVAINFSDAEQISSIQARGSLVCGTHGTSGREEGVDFTRLQLQPYEGLIIRRI